MLKYLLKLLMLMTWSSSARRSGRKARRAQAQVDLVDERDAARALHGPWMRRSSAGWIDVPVGLDGEASSTPRVRRLSRRLRPWRR
jgi:hypothetical protein